MSRSPVSAVMFFTIVKEMAIWVISFAFDVVFPRLFFVTTENPVASSCEARVTLLESVLASS